MPASLANISISPNGGAGECPCPAKRRAYLMGDHFASQSDTDVSTDNKNGRE